VKPTFYVRPVSGGYELRKDGEDGVTPLANEASAMWVASAMCLPTGGTIVVQNRHGQTVSTKRIRARG
jgi:hypothetical protein